METQKRMMLPETIQDTETQGITKQSMDNEAKNKEAFQRITTSAEARNSGRIGW
jgi:hypothetical protein